MIKELKTRIPMKHDTEENWNKATNFIPLAGEMIIYDADNGHSTPRIKIGDGITKVGNLSFISEIKDKKSIYDIGATPILNTEGSFDLEDNAESYVLLSELLMDIYKEEFESVDLVLPTQVKSLKVNDIRGGYEKAVGEQFPEGTYENLIIVSQDFNNKFNNAFIETDNTIYQWSDGFGIKHLSDKNDLNLNKSLLYNGTYQVYKNDNISTICRPEASINDIVKLNSLYQIDIVTFACLTSNIDNPTDDQKERVRQLLGVTEEDGYVLRTNDRNTLIITSKDITGYNIKKGISVGWSIPTNKDDESINPKIIQIPEFKFYYNTSGSGETYNDSANAVY